MTVETANRRITAGALLVCVLVGAATRAQAASENATPAPETQPTPDAALETMVVDSGARYAGDCATTRAPDDIGKVCSRFVDARDGVRAYLTGHTFAEFDSWVFVAGTADGWQPVGTVPLDFFAETLVVPWP